MGRMVQRVRMLLVDDVDGGEAHETIRFGVDGSTYEIDLSHENATRLRDALASWLAHARKVRNGPESKRIDLGASPQVIRAWAKANGYAVPARGRVPEKVRAAYEEAQKR